MAAMAEILLSFGLEVTGSDVQEKFFTDKVLQKLGINYFEKFSENNIPESVDLVVYSTAYNDENNVEMAEAKKRNLSMMSYPEALAALFNQKYGIAVAGTHGKTTTTALLGSVLKSTERDPLAVVGSRVIGWGTNALAGQGEFFALEADEFQNKLKLYYPKAAILTSVDWDHPDTYPTFAEYKNAFADFVGKIPQAGFLVIWGDSAATNEIAGQAKCETVKYGFRNDNDIVISKIKNQNEKVQFKIQKFNIKFNGKDLGNFETQLIGDHNLLNCGAVIAVCQKLNVDMEKVREAVANFQGTARRFEFIGERNGAILIDDYGHHPEEIKATLKAAREIYPEKNLIAVFHPHSYSRTEALLQEFSQSFDNADKVIVLDIYGSAREQDGKVSSKNLVELINKYFHSKAEYIPTIDGAVEFLKDKIGAADVVLCIGAGNVFEVAEGLKASV